MADKKISELVSLAGKDVAATDLFPVVDVSVAEIKSLTRDELRNAVNAIQFAATKALATTAAASLPDDTIIEVAADESLAGARTRYTVAAGALVFAYGVVTKAELDAVASGVYFVEEFRASGDTDSQVVNKALRAIELAALPGAVLRFESGRTYTYDSTQSLGLIDNLEIDLNGALLLRASGAVNTTTLSADLPTVGTPGLTLNLASIPASWVVGDLIAAVIGTANNQLSNVSRIVTLNRGTNIVTVQALLNGYTGINPYPAGTTISKSWGCFVGRPSATDSSTLLPQGANRRIRIHGGTIDGNAANQLSRSWRFASEILLHSEGGLIEDCRFQNTTAECLVGHGFTVRGCTFTDLGGSAMHTSVHDNTVAVATPTIFTENLVRRTNLFGQTASGHGEGAFTFSWGAGNTVISDNLFDGGEESLLGGFGPQTDDNPDRWLVVSGNICKGYDRLFYSVSNTYGVTIVGNTFHDCGDNTSLPTLLPAPGNLIDSNALTGNTVLPGQVRNRSLGPTTILDAGTAAPAQNTGNMLRVVRDNGSTVSATGFRQAPVTFEAEGTLTVGMASGENQSSLFSFFAPGQSAFGSAFLGYNAGTPELFFGANNAGTKIRFTSGANQLHMTLLSGGATEFAQRSGLIYIGNKDTDGSWAIDASGTDLIFKKRVAGAWVTKSTVTG